MLRDIDMVLHAYELAKWAHKGQLYKSKINGDMPYIDHVAKVVSRCTLQEASFEEIAIAWLHDVVEDTSVTQTLINAEFPLIVSLAVEAITRVKDIETYVEYIQRVKTNALARFVKLRDLEENISNCDVDDWKELRHRYEKAITKLSG